MAVSPFNVLALCAGVGGLELGIQLAAPAADAVCYVERDAYAASVLAARMASGDLRPAPIWDDLRTFDGRPWRGVVDCISGGYPCQPFSVAGSRRGDGDSRHIWPEFTRVIDEVEPTVCFLENVRGHVRIGLRDVFGDLRRRGFAVRFGVFSAAEVDAPHRRERVFILAAHPDRVAVRQLPEWDQWQGWSQRAPKRRDVIARVSSSARAATRSPGWSAQPAIHGVDDGMAPWVDRLRAAGNGAVPQQASLAWRELWRLM